MFVSEDSNLSDEENYSDELGSDESSGKDWSDLEAEAAESDNNRLVFICIISCEILIQNSKSTNMLTYFQTFKRFSYKCT